MNVYLHVGGGIAWPFFRSYQATKIGDSLMEMYLQFGHGMMGHTRELLSSWNGSGVVLSPRDLNERQLETLAADVLKIGGQVLLDPQCYSHTADHARLTSHKYWRIYKENSTNALIDGSANAELLAALSELSNQLGVTRHILPGVMAPVVNDDWFSMQESTINEAPNHFGSDDRLLATCALSAEALADENQIEDLIDQARSWNVGGYYVVPETPTSYLVDDPIWLSNVLKLLAGLKLHNREVIVGYASHQLLSAAAANVDAICSGTWLNVRAFPIEKFFAPNEDEVSRRATWYYQPEALSEYKLPFLNIAFSGGNLKELAPPPWSPQEYSAPLFSGIQPTQVDWSEQQAFRHYLSSLRAQAVRCHKANFAETFEEQNRVLDAAEKKLKRFKEIGVLGQDRDFRDRVDVNRAALISLKQAYGPRLNRSW